MDEHAARVAQRLREGVGRRPRARRGLVWRGGLERPRMCSLPARIAVGAVVLVGCEKGGVAGQDRCPTQEQISRMASDDLNQIPRLCDERTRLDDAPGVRVTNDGDDRDGMPTSVAKEIFGPPGEVLPAEIDHVGDVDFWGLQWPGGAIRVVATSSGSRAQVAVTDLHGAPRLGGIGADAVSDLRGALPAGRYLVRVFSADAQAPFGYELVSNEDDR